MLKQIMRILNIEYYFEKYNCKAGYLVYIFVKSMTSSNNQL